MHKNATLFEYITIHTTPHLSNRDIENGKLTLEVITIMINYANYER